MSPVTPRSLSELRSMQVKRSQNGTQGRVRFSTAAVIAACLSCVVSTAAHAATSDGQVEFNRDVRPILSDNCFACHGFDKNKRKADLRLDLLDAATAERKEGVRAIVPGDPANSEVWKRINHADPDELMPPA